MLDAVSWQAVLDHNAALFAELEAGTAAVLVAQSAWASGSGESLRWRREADGMRATPAAWRGVETCDAELIFVAMRDALPRLAAVPAADRLGLLRDQVREGDVLFFVMRSCSDLDAGWDAFLELLGRAYMGACR